MVGGDLLDEFAVAAPVDVFGMGSVRETDRINAIGNLPQDALHAALAERRLYLHTTRWTSLGLSLVEAMQLGMPIVAVAATEVVDAVPESAGVISTDIERLKHAVRDYVNDPEAARIAGKAARTYALSRYGLPRFLAEWDRLLEEVTS
jgi:glycosyltransferase involved in cell wall biosynthesis